MEAKRKIIVIGGSAGGVQAIPALLSSFAPDIPASFFVTLHIPPHAESYMPRLIERSGNLPAVHPPDGSPIRTGVVYVAPPDFHLIVGLDEIRLSHGPKENRHRPAIDVMFRSAAHNHGESVAGVLLTGNLDDGVAGLREIQRYSGLSIVQDPAEAAYPQMPSLALQAFEPRHCLRLKEIERLLVRVAQAGSGEDKLKAKSASRKPRPSPAPARKKGKAVDFVCPECHGPLREISDKNLKRFRCLVGHRYTLSSLLEAHGEEVEAALWIALRALEERANLQRRLARESKTERREGNYQVFKARADENVRHAQFLRELLDRFRG